VRGALYRHNSVQLRAVGWAFSSWVVTDLFAGSKKASRGVWLEPETFHSRQPFSVDGHLFPREPDCPQNAREWREHMGGDFDQRANSLSETPEEQWTAPGTGLLNQIVPGFAVGATARLHDCTTAPFAAWYGRTDRSLDLEITNSRKCPRVHRRQAKEPGPICRSHRDGFCAEGGSPAWHVVTMCPRRMGINTSEIGSPGQFVGKGRNVRCLPCPKSRVPSCLRAKAALCPIIDWGSPQNSTVGRRRRYGNWSKSEIFTPVLKPWIRDDQQRRKVAIVQGIECLWSGQ
jgi:hypothetical protein